MKLKKKMSVWAVVGGVIALIFVLISQAGAQEDLHGADEVAKRAVCETPGRPRVAHATMHGP